MTLNEIVISIGILTRNPDSLDWVGYANAKYDPYFIEDYSEKQEFLHMIRGISEVFAWGSAIHLKLAKAVSQSLGVKYVKHERLSYALAAFLFDKTLSDVTTLIRPKPIKRCLLSRN